MKDNWSMNDIEMVWNKKIEAHNDIINYLELKGFEEKELLKFVELLKIYSKSAIKLNNYIKSQKDITKISCHLLVTFLLFWA